MLELAKSLDNRRDRERNPFHMTPKSDADTDGHRSSGSGLTPRWQSGHSASPRRGTRRVDHRNGREREQGGVPGGRGDGDRGVPSQEQRHHLLLPPSLSSHSLAYRNPRGRVPHQKRRISISCGTPLHTDKRTESSSRGLTRLKRSRSLQEDHIRGLRDTTSTGFMSRGEPSNQSLSDGQVENCAKREGLSPHASTKGGGTVPLVVTTQSLPLPRSLSQPYRGGIGEESMTYAYNGGHLRRSLSSQCPPSRSSLKMGGSCSSSKTNAYDWLNNGGLGSPRSRDNKSSSGDECWDKKNTKKSPGRGGRAASNLMEHLGSNEKRKSEYASGYDQGKKDAYANCVAELRRSILRGEHSGSASSENNTKMHESIYEDIERGRSRSIRRVEKRPNSSKRSSVTEKRPSSRRSCEDIERRFSSVEKRRSGGLKEKDLTHSTRDESGSGRSALPDASITCSKQRSVRNSIKKSASYLQNLFEVPANLTFSRRENIRTGLRHVQGYTSAALVMAIWDRLIWLRLFFYVWQRNGGATILPIWSSLQENQSNWIAYIAALFAPLYLVIISKIIAEISAQCQSTVGISFLLFFAPMGAIVSTLFYAMLIIMLLWMERIMGVCYPDNGPFAGTRLECGWDAAMWSNVCPKYGTVECYNIILLMYTRFRSALYYSTYTFALTVTFSLLAAWWSLATRRMIHRYRKHKAEKELKQVKGEVKNIRTESDKRRERRTRGLRRLLNSPTRSRTRTLSPKRARTLSPKRIRTRVRSPDAPHGCPKKTWQSSAKQVMRRTKRDLPKVFLVSRPASSSANKMSSSKMSERAATTTKEAQVRNRSPTPSKRSEGTTTATSSRHRTPPTSSSKKPDKNKSSSSRDGAPNPPNKMPSENRKRSPTRSWTPMSSKLSDGRRTPPGNRTPISSPSRLSDGRRTSNGSKAPTTTTQEREKPCGLYKAKRWLSVGGLKKCTL